jgi:hypothetical protein
MPPAVGTVPALFQHCCAVYERMKEKADVIEEGEHEGLYIYTGRLTQEFIDLELGQPYYTSVMKRLKQMHCVEQLQRGGGQSPSKWLLLSRPTLDVYQNAAADNTQGGADGIVVRALKQNISDLSQRLSRQESENARLRDAMELLANKFATLERKWAEYETRP